MTTLEVHRLRNQLQAGVMLVDDLLRVYGPSISKSDASLVRDLRSWIAGGVPVNAPSTRLSPLHCGPLRRESDGGWWWRAHFLGADGDPQTSLNLADDDGLIVMALAAALDRAAGRLDAASDDVGFRAARRVLSQYHHWQSAGVW